MKEVRVRYAPSPTGYLHIGNARTALFNYLYARHTSGKFIIRIEDTDIARNIEGGEESQLKNLKWLGINWDESIDLGGDYGPYNQLKRVEEGIYLKYVNQLLEEDKAYKCFCSSEELEDEANKQKENGQIPRYSEKCRYLSKEEVKQFEEEGKEYSIRFKVPSDYEIKWHDTVKRDVVFNTKDVSGDFNIIKRDGIPTYNFAVSVDDHLMKITNVLRGEDHISNTPKQILIYEALNFNIPEFTHMTLITNESGKKLSKRDTSIVQYVEEYKELGYLPEAMFNFISLLGWSPGSEEEIFDQERLIEMFDINRLSTSSAKFDVDKLSWINKQYIQKLSKDKYFSLTKEFISNSNENSYTDEELKEIASLYQDQISHGSEINQVSKLFFEEMNLEGEAQEFLKQEGIKNLLEIFLEKVESSDNIEVEEIKNLIKESGEEAQMKGKLLFMPIRIASTTQMQGPDLPTTIKLLKKEKVIKNIKQAINDC